MKFTAYQHKQIAKRYESKINWGLYSKDHNEKYTRLVEKHIRQYIEMTGQLPE